jgi:hypothetical protein
MNKKKMKRREQKRSREIYSPKNGPRIINNLLLRGDDTLAGEKQIPLDTDLLAGHMVAHADRN